MTARNRAVSFIGSWQKTEQPVTPSENGETHHYTYTDPATKLKIAADVRTYTDFDAIEWILHITNEGASDSPILEDIQAMNWSVACETPDAMVHSLGGSNQSLPDFMPLDNNLPPGRLLPIGADRGRSSGGSSDPMGHTGGSPYFNLQTGDHGVIGAIGWTGSWMGYFNRPKPGKVINLKAGFVKTHLKLHPGETIRTARILLMNWKGDWIDSQNIWRKLILAHYSPKDPQGQVIPGPVCFCSGGNEPIANKLATVQFMHDKKIPADLYWIDAGWYGTDPKNSTGQSNSGSWTPNPTFYPNGFKPLGDALKQAHIDFLVWFEPETAMPGTELVTAHPDWFIHPNTPVNEDQPYLLNLGNPAALKGMTDFVSKTITDSGMTWYRQDFNFYPDVYFAFADTPDRVGMTEIQHIEGLYAFWDALLAQHPGLRIDNCSSGGRRLDIEMISRSYALHRSDYAGRPLGEQVHTQGLAPWAVPPQRRHRRKPRHHDPANNTQLYNWRCGYSSGINMAIDAKNFGNDAPRSIPHGPASRNFSISGPTPTAISTRSSPYSLEENVWTAFQWNPPRPQVRRARLPAPSRQLLLRPGSRPPRHRPQRHLRRRSPHEPEQRPSPANIRQRPRPFQDHPLRKTRLRHRVLQAALRISVVAAVYDRRII